METESEVSQTHLTDTESNLPDLDSLLKIKAYLTSFNGSEEPEDFSYQELDFLFQERGESSSSREADRASQFQEDVIRDACEKGTDLRVYAADVHTELVDAEARLVMEFLELVPTIVELSQQVEVCDKVLVTMETLLGGFQTHLSKLNEAIQTIQGQSITLQDRLTTRLEVHEKVSKVIDGLVISPRTLRTLVNGQIGNEYISSLKKLTANYQFMQSFSPSGQKSALIKAVKEIAPEHDKLRFKTASTIRKFFIEQFAELSHTKDTTLFNFNQFQKERLLPYQTLNHLVLLRHPGVAAEIAQHYVIRASSYHMQYFEFYLKGLLGFQVQVSDRYDLIGNDDTPKKGLLDLRYFGAAKTALKDKYNLFSLGNRLNILDFSPEWNGPIRLPEAERTFARIRFEDIFKSFNVTLAVSMGLEFHFLEQFFTLTCDDSKTMPMPMPMPPEYSLTSMFRSIFEPIFKKAHAVYREYIDNTYDAIGVLLCIRLNGQFCNELTQLNIPIVDADYFHANDRLFWPRFQIINNLHITSLKKTNMVPSTNPKDSNPHYLTRRYAEFAASIVTLTHGYDEPMLINGLARLRCEYLDVLNRMANRIRHSKSKLVFLLNNYDLVQGILAEHPPRTTEGEMAHFKQIHSTCLAEYIKHELSPLFGDIISLVDQTDDSNLTSPDPSVFVRLANHFNLTYKSSLAKLNSSVNSNFPNLHHATNILHSMLAHIMLIYTKFLTLIDSHFSGKNSLPGVQPISVHQLKIELKKYRTNL